MGTFGNGVESIRRYAILSEMSPEWAEVAPEHEKSAELAEALYNLPLHEFRKVPYKPPPIPADAPVPGQDIDIREQELQVRDGSMVVIRIYQPHKIGQDHILFFNIHGGGWTVGSPETEEAQNRYIASRNGAVVVSVDYRRAPEFPFPFALEDSYDALVWCMNNAESLRIDKHKIILGGGSAGANIAAALAQAARDERISGIIGQILNIPVTCHPDHFPGSKYEYASYEQNANAPIVNAARMRLYWKYYLPSATADSRASPLLADSLSDLPPALIQVAGMDPLRDEGLAYAEGLKTSGVDVSLKIHNGLPHAFYVYPNLKSTRLYFETMVNWIQNLTSKKGSLDDSGA